jgi:hypothetical protein
MSTKETAAEAEVAATSSLTPGDYRFIGNHAIEFDMISTGAQLQIGPGDYVTLTQEDIYAAEAHNAEILNYLIDATGSMPQAETAVAETEAVEETTPTKTTAKGGAKT